MDSNRLATRPAAPRPTTTTSERARRLAAALLGGNSAPNAPTRRLLLLQQLLAAGLVSSRRPFSCLARTEPGRPLAEPPAISKITLTLAGQLRAGLHSRAEPAEGLSALARSTLPSCQKPRATTRQPRRLRSTSMQRCWLCLGGSQALARTVVGLRAPSGMQVAFAGQSTRPLPAEGFVLSRRRRRRNRRRNAPSTCREPTVRRAAQCELPLPGSSSCRLKWRSDGSFGWIEIAGSNSASASD